MIAERSNDYLAELVMNLCKLPSETEWVEFKENKSEPQEIGRYISALANSAALESKEFTYMIWGVCDKERAVIGTTFNPRTKKKGNEELVNWLSYIMKPEVDFHFSTVTINNQKVVLLEIGRATHRPVSFSGTEYIRIGSYKKKLKDFPEKERALWRIFDRTPFEEGVAAEHQRDEEVLQLLDYPAYFDLLEAPLPESRKGVLSALAEDNLIRRCETGKWNITNLGAILFAKNLRDFPQLKRKAVRIIQYRNADRTEALKEQENMKGYACGFEGVVGYINGLLPANEIIDQALRRTVPIFPELAVRELVANALIHQDFFVTGAGPMVEIFDDRIEIANPGKSLVDTERFMDAPPKSRNDMLASLLRRFGICEERGSGIDKVVFQVELYQLPAPLFEVPGESTRTVLFAPKSLTDMSKADRVRACYLHACLCCVTNKTMNNTSIRKRFGISEENVSLASKILKEALESRFIIIRDPKVGTRNRAYLPFWAG